MRQGGPQETRTGGGRDNSQERREGALQERYYRARREGTASRTNNHVKIDACVLVNASGNFAIFGLFFGKWAWVL